MRLLSTRTLIGLLLALAAARLVANGGYPLADPYEARDAEIARLMLAQGDWITPQQDPGIPFWAHLPLASWLQAGSMAMLGVNEFAVRLPAWLAAVACGALLFALARTRQPGTPGPSLRSASGPPAPVAASSALHAWLALLLFASMPLAFSRAGSALPEMTIAAALTLLLVGLWRGAVSGSRAPALAGFAGLGLTLLAGGPLWLIVAALAGALFWVLEGARPAALRPLWRRLPWLSGVALAAALSAPWFIAAELRTPGFLDYFLHGHLLRGFLTPGWDDRYGVIAREPYAAMGWFAVQAAGPWLLLGAWAAWDAWRLARRGAQPLWTSLDRFLLAWALAPLLLFSATRNTGPGLVLPALPALALLLARRCRPDCGMVRFGVPALAAALATLLAGAHLLWLPREEERIRRSTQPLLAAAAQAAQDPAAPLYVLGRVRPSLKFYSRASAVAINPVTLGSVLAQPIELFIVVETAQPERIPPPLRGQGTLLGMYDGLALVHRPALAPD